MSALRGDPYSQGGTGKYGLLSERMLECSASLLMMMKGEQRGTGAGTPSGYTNNTCNNKLSYF